MKNTNSLKSKTSPKDFLSVVIPYAILREKEGVETVVSTSVAAPVVTTPASSSKNSTTSQVSSGKNGKVTSSSSSARDSPVVRRSPSSMTICSNMHHLSFKVSPLGKFHLLFTPYIYPCFPLYWRYISFLSKSLSKMLKNPHGFRYACEAEI